MTKQEIRKLYLNKRLALPDSEYLRLNRQLCDVFFSGVNLSSIHLLHTFLPIISKREPDTWMIIDRIRREYPPIQLSVPRINDQIYSLESFDYEGLHQITENPWGIPEPSQGTQTAVEKIDIVLVPLLAFDKNGHRVGYGKGYYDRFLSLCRTDCIKTGLSLFPPEENRIDIAPYDQKLDIVITPERFYRF